MESHTEDNTHQNTTPEVNPENTNGLPPTIPSTELIETEAKPLTIEVPVEQLENLVAQLKKYKAQEQLLKSVAIQAGIAFGLVDPVTKQMITPPEGTSQGSIIIGALMKKISFTKLMFNADTELEKLTKEFGFFSELVPIFEDYANGNGN